MHQLRDERICQSKEGERINSRLREQHMPRCSGRNETDSSEQSDGGWSGRRGGGRGSPGILEKQGGDISDPCLLKLCAVGRQRGRLPRLSRREVVAVGVSGEGQGDSEKRDWEL